MPFSLIYADGNHDPNQQQHRDETLEWPLAGDKFAGKPQRCRVGIMEETDESDIAGVEPASVECRHSKYVLFWPSSKSPSSIERTALLRRSCLEPSMGWTINAAEDQMHPMQFEYTIFDCQSLV
ncbi:hypothetical protein AC1031_021906 [Aphanomyces cochlioides]|nr:hypothetical protein AC1031_021906 [Aphanomyces cochlioides]